MDEENQKPRSRRLPKLSTRNRKHDKPSPSLGERKDEVEDESDYTSGHLSYQSLEFDPCILTNEQRFQEIVPLNTLNVIGAEDPTVATNWKLLVGRTLNNKYECPWLTPMLNSLSGENYPREENTNSKKRSYNSDAGTPETAEWKTQNVKQKEDSSYTMVASKKMVGVFISVWMRLELLNKYCISNVKVCSVACGIMGHLGNKGSVAVSMLIEGTNFCFVVAHLASGEKGDEDRRNHRFWRFLGELVSRQLPDTTIILVLLPS